jgi:hypothetical protein
LDRLIVYFQLLQHSKLYVRPVRGVGIGNCWIYPITRSTHGATSGFCRERRKLPFPFSSFWPPTDGICSGGFFDGAASRPARRSNADFSRRKLSLFVLSDANWPANVPSPSEETPLINFFSSPAVRSLLARSRRPLDEINFGPSKAKLFDYICEKCEPKGDSFA